VSLRIAQVSPLYESVPPRLYGGTERVVSYLTEELVGQGHEVTLFASGDSRTRARLISPCHEALRLSGSRDPLALHVLLLEQVVSRADEFDLIHFHTDFVHFPLSRRLATATVTTLHGRLDIPELAPLYAEFTDIPLVSISDAQRAPIPYAGWEATVYHGLPRNLLPLGQGRGGYLAFTGRVSTEKQPELAIAIARRAGIPLKIAAKVDRADHEHFERVVRPLLDGPGVEFIGEINESQKAAFLGDAAALLFPINWPEPFGLVMIEAMACGTPVIAFPRGSVPEVLDEGVTGLMVNDEDEAVAAVPRALALDRRACRRQFEARFAARRMAEDYLRVYRRLVAARAGRDQSGPAGALHGRHGPD
jgi:glycosyltransferase involved in cell wall biosynthesis